MGVSVEAYWRRSPSEREWHEKRWTERRGRCGHCNLPRAVCGDSAAKFYPQREVCYASMEREAANEKWKALHEARQWHDGTFTSWAEKRSDDHPYPRDAGVTIGVAETDIRPDDHFLTRESWGPDQKPTEEEVDE